MNTLKNTVRLIGRLGAQPELSTLESGKTVARISIATNENYKNKSGEWVENTQWHTIKAWGKVAESASKHLNKGEEIILEGRLQNSNYETKSGEKRFVTEIIAKDFLKLNSTASVPAK